MLYNQEITLEEMIGGNTKAEVLKNADDLGIRVQRNVRKAVIVSKVAYTILRHPLILMHHLPWHELLKLQHMVHDDRHAFAVGKHESFPLECLTELGITDSTADGDLFYDFIYSDLADALRPVIDNYLATLDPNSGKILLERTILGLLNLYGILTSGELTRFVRDYLPELQEHTIHAALNDSFLFRRCICYKLNLQLWYRSPFMDNPESVLVEIVPRPIFGKARFSREEVLAAADMRAPQPPRNAKSEAVEQILRPRFPSTKEMNEWISLAWNFTNNDLQVFERIVGILDTQSMTRDEAQRTISLMIEWTNHLPRWILLGNSSHTIHELKKQQKQQPPRTARYYEHGEAPSRPNLHLSRKVGRNDPCPCGSGKKYKHCCGAN